MKKLIVCLGVLVSGFRLRARAGADTFTLGSYNVLLRL